MSFENSVRDNDLNMDNLRSSHKEKTWIKCTKICLTISGLYYEPLTITKLLRLVFPVAVFLITVTESCRQYFHYQPDEMFNMKMLRILVYVSMIQIVLTEIIFLTSITPKLRQFFHEYNVFYCNYESSVEITKNDVNDFPFKKKVLCSYLVLFPLRAFVQVTALYYLAGFQMWYGDWFLTSEPVVVYLLKPLVSVMLVFFRLINATAVVFVYILCTIIGHDYDVMTSDANSFLQKLSNEEDCTSMIRNFRQQFLHLSKLAHDADDICGPLSLTIIVFDIMGLILHVIGFFDMSFFGLSNYMAVGFVCLSALVIFINLSHFLHSCLLLHAKAMAIKPMLLFANIQQTSHDFLREVTMILHKLTHDFIGFTAYGLFNINKAFIVSLVTISMSYVVITVRFTITMMRNMQNNDNNFNYSVSTPMTNTVCHCPTTMPA